MLTEEVHAAGVADGKIVEHEDAAHEKRNWVRLTYRCNDHCVFCLDSDAHDGTDRQRDEIVEQIVDGRRKGATRLILSGGEPTIHPDYVRFIQLGAAAGYRWIQTVTNGRMFAYAEFLQKCVDAGLTEITFSVHGPNAKVHDALVGTRGAYEQEMRGLRNALDDGRVVVNIDVVINRANVRHLPAMLEKYIDMGVKEFDLLQVVPFGRAFTDGRDTLFYDLVEARPYLQAALAYSKRPDVHLWMNRFPPQHLEGYEHLIQDPYKLNDEVRGRAPEFARLLEHGEDLDCREPSRCGYCYLQRLCDSLYAARDRVVAGEDAPIIRVDTESEAAQPAVFGGDPASSRRSRAGARGGARADGKVGLHVVESEVQVEAARVDAVPLPALAARAGTERLWVRAPDVARALQVRAQFPTVPQVELELDDVTGVEAVEAVVRVVASGAAQARQLVAMQGTFEIAVPLTHAVVAWLDEMAGDVPARVVLFQPTYERLTEAATQDVDLRQVLGRLGAAVPVEGVPACVLGRAPRVRPTVVDGAMMDVEGRLEIFRFTRRFIVADYFTKSLRCGACAQDARCRGMHINYVRAHGYRLMEPVTAGGGGEVEVARGRLAEAGVTTG
jgi:molybdenum cofactor biosynthesis enzyme MoaA